MDPGNDSPPDGMPPAPAGAPGLEQAVEPPQVSPIRPAGGGKRRPPTPVALSERPRREKAGQRVKRLYESDDDEEVPSEPESPPPEGRRATRGARGGNDRSDPMFSAPAAAAPRGGAAAPKRVGPSAAKRANRSGQKAWPKFEAHLLLCGNKLLTAAATARSHARLEIADINAAAPRSTEAILACMVRRPAEVDGGLPFLELTLVEVIQAAAGQTAAQASHSVSRLQLSLAVDRALDALVEATEASPLLAVITPTRQRGESFAFSRAWSVLLQAAKAVLLCNKQPKGTGSVTAFLRSELLSRVRGLPQVQGRPRGPARRLELRRQAR